MDQKPAAPAAFYHNSLQPSSGARHQPTHTFHSTPLLPFPCTQGTPGRVVVLSSSAHGFGRIHIEDLNCERRWYGAWATYGNAKLVRGWAGCARQGSLVPLCRAGCMCSGERGCLHFWPSNCFPALWHCIHVMRHNN